MPPFISGDEVGMWHAAWYECSVAQSCPILCGPVDCSPPDSSVHGIFQAGILEWDAISFFRGSSNPEIEPTAVASRALAGGFFTTSTTWEVLWYMLLLLLSRFSPV